MSNEVGTYKSRLKRVENENKLIKILIELSKEGDNKILEELSKDSEISICIMLILQNDDDYLNFLRGFIHDNLNISYRLINTLKEDIQTIINITLNKDLISIVNSLKKILNGQNESYVSKRKFYRNVIDSLRKYIAKNAAKKFIKIVAKAKKDSLTTKQLLTLSQDNFILVRVEVALNDKTPLNILEKLAKDSNSYVRSYVASNKNISQKIFRSLAKDEIQDVRRELSRNSNITPDILEILSEDRDRFIRAIVASNIKTPRNSLAVLVEDSNQFVRKAALKTFKKVMRS